MTSGKGGRVEPGVERVCGEIGGEFVPGREASAEPGGEGIVAADPAETVDGNPIEAGEVGSGGDQDRGGIGRRGIVERIPEDGSGEHERAVEHGSRGRTRRSRVRARRGLAELRGRTLPGPRLAVGVSQTSADRRFGYRAGHDRRGSSGHRRRARCSAHRASNRAMPRSAWAWHHCVGVRSNLIR